jgi:hypothetical protein
MTPCGGPVCSGSPRQRLSDEPGRSTPDHEWTVAREDAMDEVRGFVWRSEFQLGMREAMNSTARRTPDSPGRNGSSFSMLRSSS